MDLNIPPTPTEAAAAAASSSSSSSALAAGGGDDAFKTRVSTLVDAWLRDTLRFALCSVSVNGMDAAAAPLGEFGAEAANAAPAANADGEAEAEAGTNYEAYDPRLAERVRSLYAEVEREGMRVAGLRREEPERAAGRWVGWFEGLGEEEEEEEEEIKRETGEVKMERGEEVRRAWERGVGGLVGLERMTETRAKMERAREAVGVVGRGMR